MQKHQWRTNDVGLSIHCGKTDSQLARKILLSISDLRRMFRNGNLIRERNAGPGCGCCGLYGCGRRGEGSRSGFCIGLGTSLRGGRGLGAQRRE